MIALLRGRVLDKQPNRIILDVSGVGYDVQIPLSTFYEVGEEGTEVSLRIYTHADRLSRWSANVCSGGLSGPLNSLRMS